MGGGGGPGWWLHDENDPLCDVIPPKPGWDQNCLAQRKVPLWCRRRRLSGPKPQKRVSESASERASVSVCEAVFFPQPYLNCFVRSLLHSPLRMPSVSRVAWEKTLYGVCECASVWRSLEDALQLIDLYICFHKVFDNVSNDVKEMYIRF